MTKTHDRLQTGSATVSADADFSDGPFTVHGVAQASEVTQGVSSERRFWPPETLRDAADQLVGTPIVDPDDHEQLTAGQPHPDIVIGEVTDAAYDDGRDALVFEGEVDDPDRARQIARGRVDVSPSVALEPGADDADRDAQRVDAVLGYRDLAVVTDGAHASASIDVGTAEALADHFDVAAEALQREQARRPSYTGTQDADWSTPTLDDYLSGYDSLPAPDDVDSVADLSQDGRALIADKSLLGTPSGETLRDVRFFPVVDPETDELNRRALGAVRSGRGEQADIPDDARASAQRMAGELLNEAFDADVDVEAAQAQPDDHRGGDDGPHGGSDQSTPATWRTHMSDDLTDHERELLAAAGQKDDPTVVEAGVVERLSDHDELLDDAEAMDSPTLVEEPDYDALQERVKTVESLMADALQERTGLSDAAVDAMPFEAMAAEFETDDGDLDFDALTQSPEAGGSPPADDGGDGPDEDDLARISEIDTKLDTVGNALPDSRIEALREEAADLADADDYEAALEVL